MADITDVEVKEPSDYLEVVEDISQELLAQLTTGEDGSIIQMFQTGSFDPAQMFVFFGALESALLQFRTDKRCKTVLVHAQPSSLYGIGQVVTPVTTLLEHIGMNRLDDVSNNRLEIGHIMFTGEELTYHGDDLKGRYVVVICDLLDDGSPYLEACIDLCHEMKASHVVAIPMMVWNPDLIDNLSVDSIKEALDNHENTIIS